MISKRTKTTVMAMLLLLCCVITYSGIMTVNAYAQPESTVLYECDFEALATNATADDIYGATYFAGANRSIIEEGSNYIEAIYTFWDNGCQHAPLYMDTNRGISSTDASKTYTLEIEFMTFGSTVKNMILGLQGPDTTAFNSAVTFNVDGTASAADFAGEFVTLKSATLGADGWWKATIEMKGTGGYLYPVFYMNIDPAKFEEVNAALDTGIRLSEFKVTEGENTVYDLTVTEGISGSDALYQATAFGYGGHSVVTKQGAGIEGKTLKAVYTFWDNGFQHEGAYINENALNVKLETGKQYVVEMDVEMFGSAQQVYSIFNQVGVENTAFDSQIILNADGTYIVAEYQTKMFEETEVTFNGGVFHIKATINGMGGLLKFYFNMYSNNYEDANANMNTGLYLDNIMIVEVGGESGEVTYFEITFNVNGVTETVEVASGDTIETPADPLIEGYDFTGWFTNEECTSPADFTQPITENTTFYAGFEKIVYTVEESSNLSWNVNDKQDIWLTVHRGRNDGQTFGLFKGLVFNGKEVDPSYYNTENGSLKLTVKSELFEEIPSGTYDLVVLFNDGSVSTRVTIDQTTVAPPTGESMQIVFCAILALSSLALFAIVVDRVYRKKAHH